MISYTISYKIGYSNKSFDIIVKVMISYVAMTSQLISYL